MKIQLEEPYLRWSFPHLLFPCTPSLCSPRLLCPVLPQGTVPGDCRLGSPSTSLVTAGSCLPVCMGSGRLLHFSQPGDFSSLLPTPSKKERGSGRGGEREKKTKTFFFYSSLESCTLIFDPCWLIHRLGFIRSQNVPLVLNFILTLMIITQEEQFSIGADGF